jgi:hypothetical protein
MGKDDKNEEERGPMAGCPVPVVKVDEAKLLNDCRSPRFFKACQKLQIDPGDLRPREFQSFAEPGLLPEKQQIRMAMYERQRLSKWQTINDLRFLLPKGDKMPARSQSAELFRTSTEQFASTNISWVPAERARTLLQARNGKVEVLKSTAKRLRDITAVGDYASAEREEQRQKAIAAKLEAERRKKEIIMKDKEKEALRKEKAKKERKEREEREQLQREQEENLQKKLKALQESWEAESAEKQRRQQEQVDRVNQNLAEASRKKEEEVQKLLQGFERKEQQVNKMRDAIMNGGGDGAGTPSLHTLCHHALPLLSSINFSSLPALMLLIVLFPPRLSFYRFSFVCARAMFVALVFYVPFPVFCFRSFLFGCDLLLPRSG